MFPQINKIMIVILRKLILVFVSAFSFTSKLSNVLIYWRSLNLMRKNELFWQVKEKINLVSSQGSTPKIQELIKQTVDYFGKWPTDLSSWWCILWIQWCASRCTMNRNICEPLLIAVWHCKMCNLMIGAGFLLNIMSVATVALFICWL